MEMDEKISKSVGDYLVVEMSGLSGLYLAEVTKSVPLRVKLKDDGPFSCIKENKIKVHERETALLQKTVARGEREIFARFIADSGRDVRCGLASLGVKDNDFHYILPVVAA